MLSEFNITHRRLVSGKYKDLGSPLKEMTTEEMVIFQTVIDEIHGEFVNTVAKNREMDVEKVKELTYDLIFMDENMPNMNGIEASSQIRQLESETKNHIPIIAVTADATEATRQRVLKLGMNDYMTKPVRQMETIARVNAIYRRP